MHSRVLAERNYNAQARLIAAAQALGQANGLDESLVSALTPGGPAPQEVKALLQKEAVADLLEALLAAGQAARLAAKKAGQGSGREAGQKAISKAKAKTQPEPEGE